jgi:hypothetical protein
VAPTSTNRAQLAATTPEAQLSFTNDNAELMIILMALDVGPNANNARNPQRRAYAGAVKHAKSPTAPGWSPLPPAGNGDGNFRDRFGNPYIVSLDLNYDNKVDDPVYGRIPGAVLVWSVGPDGRYEVPANATQDPYNLPLNKDNILHWR